MSDNELVFWLCVICAVIALAGGIGLGRAIRQTELRREAAFVGAGRFRIDERTGVQRFEWATNTSGVWPVAVTNKAVYP